MVENNTFKSIKALCISQTLKKYIVKFWEVTSNTEKATTNLLLPVTNNDIILYMSTPLTYHFHTGDVEISSPAFQGPRCKSIDVSQNGKAHIIGVTFKKFFSGVFVTTPLSRLKENVKILENISYNRKIENLNTNQLYFEEILIDLIDESKIPSNEDLLLMEELLEYPGKINEYCIERGINIKRLERLYIKYTGLTPKKFLKIFRVQMANNSILNNKLNSLTDLSYDMGYFDQTHMGKDFESIHSKKPGDFLKDNFSLKSILKKSSS